MFSYAAHIATILYIIKRMAHGLETNKRPKPRQDDLDRIT
jgi:hypothetical protein